ncbi:tetratricopeptide repeat protein [Clostridium ganghwense]|uniref:Tetratricopeptide repeat protein n=1 Tax=Clostridium ganghwense TaxID=312089 RepID=A0ABT4CJU2_9CLOT|nr:tetratricopeptide repeat protein [Clostridium ganghwense]MCY6369320.1 tetratricopeptide repeat protein [Clostridium ganghwense]
MIKNKISKYFFITVLSVSLGTSTIIPAYATSINSKEIVQQNKSMTSDQMSVKDAKEYLVKNDYKKVIEICTKVIKTNPKETAAYDYRAYSYLKLNENIRALLDCNKSIQINPSNIIAYSIRGSVHMSSKKPKEALDDFNKSISLTPKTSIEYFFRGISYSNLNKDKEAIADYSKALEIDSTEILALINRGNMYSKQGQYDKAMQDYTQIIKLDNKNFYVYANRGVVYFEKGEYNKALEDFNEVIKQNNKYSYGYVCRGAVYVKLGNYTKAVQDYKKAAELDPNNQEANTLYKNLKALLDKNKKKLDKANKIYKQIQEVYKKTQTGKNTYEEINVLKNEYEHFTSLTSTAPMDKFYKGCGKIAKEIDIYSMYKLTDDDLTRAKASETIIESEIASLKKDIEDIKVEMNQGVANDLKRIEKDLKEAKKYGYKTVEEYKKALEESKRQGYNNIEEYQKALEEEKRISTPGKLEKHLRKNFSELDTPLGKCKFTYNVSTITFYDGNGTNLTPYDFRIEINWFNFSPSDIDSSKNLSAEQKQQTKDMLRDFQKKVADEALKAFPNKKIRGGFFRDIIDKRDIEIALDNAEDLDEVLSIIDNVDSENPMTVTEYSNIQFLTWQNFESTTGSSKYDDNKITKFHWYPKDDDYKF